ncbi:MAG: hypothetical protein MUC99_04010 [Anaerolineae bacterium]|jgi:hypothetical protein|nr:hypothetical protein [Anaerolineae bacterium]
MSDPYTFNPAHLELLRCPEAVQQGGEAGRLTLINPHWVGNATSGNKYPIHNGIPYLIIKEGRRWRDTPDSQLPVPPPPPVE